jgi:CheY-like chemotaxis protein
VIDNEQAIVDGMFSLLSGWGAEVLCARSAAEAIGLDDDTLASLELILADYHIHREDGLAVIERLRQRANRMVPAVLITADRSKAVQDEAAAAGVQYLRKPVKPAALRAALSHALAQAAAAE